MPALFKKTRIGQALRPLTEWKVNAKMKRFVSVVVICLFVIMCVSCSNSDSSTDKARETLSLTGSVYVDNVASATKLAGFDVKAPSYQPEGFKPGEFPGGSFQVFKLGDPKATTDKKYPYSVLQYFYQAGKVVSNAPYFCISQSRNKISGPGDEPITINGFQGKKGKFSSANREMLYLTWNDGTTYFIIESWLTDTLSESTLLQVANSLD
jgi:hypothetical protein